MERSTRHSFDFDIRVSAAKSRGADTAARACEWDGCEEAGEYRAPRSPARLREYRWFCLDHVRAYNRSWNFFAGWEDTQVEDYVRNNATWQRPTWKLGGKAEEERRNARWTYDDLADPLGLFGREQADAAREARAANAPDPAQLPRPVSDALGALDLELPLTLSQLKRRYKELVKRFHPDANGGDRGAEDQLRRVIWAYGLLKGSRYVRT
ncbi:MAG: J domain-containing protein [Alphaproteobacteria bacterium]|nr:J domain-containing protein [Alphaproteobacteria bacterium]MDX5368237.1 J domain-containing protein [Alphaproteobacteria bacterium]MDX5463046.1 J domain-containing protein [Alphaproteobacteria bacterium]